MRPAGRPVNSSAKWASSAAPVGVVSSPSGCPPGAVSPPAVGNPASRDSTAGAGTGSTPCAVSTDPSPSAGGEATTRSGARRCRSDTALIRSTAVSMLLSSCRCSSSRPCTSASAAAKRSAIEATASATGCSRSDAYIDTISSSKVAKPGPSETLNESAVKPPRRTSSRATSRGSMPAAACAGLVARGHEVVLYASGDSHTAAELCALFPQQMPAVLGQTSYDARHVSFAFADIEQDRFDLVHDHSGFLGIAFSRYLAAPVVHTIHCAFDEQAYGFYEQFQNEVAYIGISEYQQSMGPAGMNWAGLAYNAIAVEQWPYTPQKDDYLLAFGRVCEAKGFHLSIEAARRTGHRLIMAGVLQEPYRDYFEEKVEPLIDGEQIVYEGEVSDARKRELFAHAKAFVFPITWPEPFGLVMIEAMATGTPVVALRQGSVPEVVDDGKTGFVCDTFEEFVAAVGRVGEIDPAVCRRTVEERFTVERMVADYESIYRRVLEA